MKIAVCSDIHSNLPALETFIEETKDVDQRWCLGDIVGYGPWPKECLDIVRDEFDVLLKGNHDREVSKKDETDTGSPEVMPDKWGDPTGKYANFNYMATEGARYAERQLDERDLKFLRKLNQVDTVNIEGKKFKIAHSHPKTIDKYVFPEDFINEKEHLEGYDFLLLGHTHQQHIEKFDKGIILNPGSVGQPRDGDPRSSYAIIEDGEVTIKRKGYDLESYVNKVRETGLPKEIGERVCSGR